jgi:maltooligosyltrehalose trehalohydrolase
VSNRFVRELSFGANYLGQEKTRFRFWAPTQQRVTLELGGQAMAMNRHAEGWFELEAACEPGTSYQYRLDNGLLVPDPASRAQLDDVHGPSLVVDPGAYPWRHPAWRGRPWCEAVIYELHVGVLGGFTGVRSMLPRLAELGVTVVELMPINAFPGRRNWGYDGVLPYAPASAYGTPDELKELIDTAHGLGLMIFLDVVYNHFGPDGNYLAVTAPQIFLAGSRSDWGAALDFKQPELRLLFTENALYWLMEYRFDGLRFDAVHAIGEPDWLSDTAAEIHRTVAPGRHVALVLENDRNEARFLAREFDAQWNDDGHHVLHVLLTGETESYYADYADRPAEKLARCLAEGFVYQGEPSPFRKNAPRGEKSSSLPPTAFVLFLQNHDQVGNRPCGRRLTDLAEPDALEAALSLLLLSPQIPLLFMGQEDASRTPFLFFTDHPAELAKAVRDGRRKEFAAFAGFSDPAQSERLPDPNDGATFLASIPVADPERSAQRFALIQRLLAIRRHKIVPGLDAARALDAQAIGSAAVAARWQMGGGILSILVNLGADPVAAPAMTGSLLFESRDGAAEAFARDSKLPARTTVATWTELT